MSWYVGLLAGFLALPTIHNLQFYQITFFSGASTIIGLAAFTVLGYVVACVLRHRLSWAVQFVKFGIVGGLNMMVDLGILNTLMYFTHFTSGIGYVVLKSISFVFGVTNSYLWNRAWTFQSTEKVTSKEFIKFVVVNLVGFGINVGSAAFVVNVIGVPVGIRPEVWSNVGALSSVAISMIWNFIGMKFLVFKK